MQFNLLTFLGLREHHILLDIGCGSLRAGKLFIPYLLEGHYCGIEPEPWLLEEGISKEVGQDLIEIKKPSFVNDRSFRLSAFNRIFDYLLAQSIFSHTSQTQIKQCLAEARKVMKPSSIFAATFLKGTINYAGDEWVYPECIPYTQDFMIHLVEEQGFICKPIPWTHPNDQTWMVIVRNDYDGSVLELIDHLPFMRAELDACKKRLAQLEGHPYIRIGMAIKGLLRNVKRSGN
jgi:cyclopropane fatty-acyl-phospholipid synthase-like methyltransferase